MIIITAAVFFLIGYFVGRPDDFKTVVNAGRDKMERKLKENKKNE